MDLNKGLPKVHSHTIIFVVVNLRTKYGHFISLAHPYPTTAVAQLFHNKIFQ